MVGIKTRNKSSVPFGPEKERPEIKAATALEIDKANLLDKNRTPIIRAKEIFGDDIYIIDDSMSLFGIDSKIKMNSSLMHVPFSEAQLKMMYGYALLFIVFPSAMRIVKKYNENIRISETVTSSPAAKAVFEKNMYPRFHLIMRPDLSPFLETAALTRACTIGLKEEHTSLVVQLTTLILSNAKKSAAKSIRSVSFPSPKNLAVIVKYDPRKTPEIFIKSVKSTAPIRKSISWTDKPISI